MSSAVPPVERHVTKSRWSQLSPLLDELLDLADEPARQARLAEIRAEDASLADDLQELLRRQQAMEQADFLASPIASMRGQPEAGQSIGGVYTLERELGQGGMGTVWLARRTDGRFEGMVAIKFLTASLLGPADTGRFAREGQILARLAHPNIARLIDAGISEKPGRAPQPYLVLEYVDGIPISRYCEQHVPELADRIRLFLDVLAAVAHAHNRLILHRDLKPSNILVTPGGEVKLLDFGIAKLLADTDDASPATELTRQAGRAFTPHYAAPEQLQNGEVSTATDVYALGVLLYLLLGHQHPNADPTSQDTPLERMKAVIEVEPKRLSDVVRANDPKLARELRGDIDTIVARALKKAPSDRYPNAAALADDLRRWLRHEPIVARRDSALYTFGKFVRRHRTAVGAASVAILILALSTAISLQQAYRADHAEKLAHQRSAQADDLLGFMLGDFADKLRPIGRLELLDSVGSKALKHLAADADEPGANARLQRAKALTVIGEVRVSKRDLDAAVEPLNDARQLLAGDPPEPGMTADWRKAQGAAAFWLGHIAYTKRQFEPARKAWEDYRHYSEAWLATAPGQFEPTVELSYAQNSLGSVLLDSGDLRGAAQQFQGSIALKEQALRSKPQDATLQMETADSYSWLGTALLWQGEFARARDAFVAGEKLISAVRQGASQKDLTWSYREAVMRIWLAESLTALERRDEAGAELNRATQLLRDILQQEPNTPPWAFQLIRAEADQIELSRNLAGHPAALQRLLAQLDSLDKGSSATAALRRLPQRAQIVLMQARALQAQGKAAQAQTALTPLVDMLTLAVKKRPDDLRLRIALAQARLALAGLDRARGAADEARDQCQQTASELLDARGLLRIHYDFTLAWVDVQTCLGRGGESGPERAWLAQKTAPSN
ncbi:MAG: serine/threonine protein kinase [Paucibacter sp.]|nr:serine/threonine protein kinase [Roseateles sp.]